MKIFIVENDYGLEGCTFRHAFQSLEEAVAHCDSEYDFYDFVVREYDLENHIQRSKPISLKGKKSSAR